jgi:hypothetical protein
MSFREDVSVMIPVSILPSHPSTHVLDWTIASTRSHLFNASIYLMFDGVRSEQSERKEAYEEFKRRLVFPPFAGAVHRVEFETFHHQAAMLRKTLDQVATPLMLFLESDWILTGDIPWDAMAKTILDQDADVIRLHQTSETHPEHAELFLETVEINGIRLRKQRVFWAQPFLCSTDWMRKQLAEKFSDHCRCFIEDRLYGICLKPAMWGYPDKIFMYDPIGTLKRVSHTDGRQKNPDGSPMVSKWEDQQVF